MPVRAIRRRKLRLPMSTARKARAIRRVRRKVLGGSVHAFTEKVQLASIGCPANSTVTGIQTYKLNDLTNYPAFANLFDLYKLKGVKLTMIPKWNSSDVGNGVPNAAGQGGSLPMLYIAPNRDPYVPAPTTVNDLLNDDGSKIVRLERPVSFYLKSPKPELLTGDQIAIPLQMNAGKDFWLTTGGNAQFIDQSSVKHYGHRWVIQSQAPLETVVDVYVKYYFIMKEQD